ncbi:MAG: hypothetical protein ACOH1P_03640 [Lysobacter sp.]
MKTTLTSRMFALTAAVSALTGIGQAAAQDFTFEWNPRTGDAWVDNWLDDVNRYGSRYRQPFVDEMVRYHGAPRELVDALLAERHWAPGDVYYACAIARIIGRPCRYVVDEWERDHAQGWGAVAERLGIKPGSAEFHRIKRGFVPTYDRWGRPIRIDEDLYRYYPERAKAMQAAQSQRGGNGAGPKGKAAGRGKKAAAKPPAGNAGRKAAGSKVDDRKTGDGKATGDNR